MELEKLEGILGLHECWLRGEPEGVKADLQGANLKKVILQEANLRGASYNPLTIL